MSITKSNKRKMIMFLVFSAFFFYAAMYSGVDVLAAGKTTADTAEANNVVSGLNTLYSAFGGIVSSIGSMIALWGFFEIGMAFQSNEGTMLSGSIKRVAGGLLVVFAPTFVTLIGATAQTTQ